VAYSSMFKVMFMHRKPLTLLCMVNTHCHPNVVEYMGCGYYVHIDARPVSTHYQEEGLVLMLEFR
jgi:hypothetical protein